MSMEGEEVRTRIMAGAIDNSIYSADGITLRDEFVLKNVVFKDKLRSEVYFVLEMAVFKDKVPCWLEKS